MTLYEYLLDKLELEELGMFMAEPAFTLNLEEFEKDENE